jgi:hypothetical protein
MRAVAPKEKKNLFNTPFVAFLALALRHTTTIFLIFCSRVALETATLQYGT